jgi:hypothetical protein
MNTNRRFVRTVPVRLRRPRAVTVDILGEERSASIARLLVTMRWTAVLR